jgi:hypothetical protein
MDRRQEQQTKDYSGKDPEKWQQRKENIRRVVRNLEKEIYGKTPEYVKKNN